MDPEKMAMAEHAGQSVKRLLYLSGALRVSTHPRATVGGARSHVLGVVKAFRKLRWRVSSFIVGDLVPLRWLSRSLDRETRPSPGKRIAADLIRLLCGYFSGLLVVFKFCHVDWAYERAGSFQNLGARLKKKGIPWILETNALLYQEAFMDRQAVFFHRLAKKMEIKAYRNCDALVCVSEGLKGKVVAASGIDPQKVVVTANGVDADMFNPDIRPAKRFFKEPTIGFVGTMYAWQGLDLLLSALAAFPKDDCGRKLVLVGDGPELHNLRKLAAELGLGADVHFSGRVEWQDIPACIAGFDIGYSGQIGTSAGDWCGSPIKIYEFMAMRKPVIAAAWEDACRVIVPGRTGYLYTPGDPRALSESLAAALAEKENWPEMGRLARIEIERSCTWTARVGSMIPQIEQILNKHEKL
jgi:glycosyltransferase involved in cell wall biosynthesis